MVTVTKKLAFASMFDVYHRALRKGKSQDEAADIAQEHFDDLFEFIGGPECWIDLPND